MSTRRVSSSTGLRLGPHGGRARSGERAAVFAVGALIVTIVGAYLAVNSMLFDPDPRRYLRPYQALVRTLIDSDRAMFYAVRDVSVEAERERDQTGRWPDASTLSWSANAAGEPRPSDANRWTFVENGFFMNYLGIPADPAAPAWLVFVQEPDPAAMPDPAPFDEEHRLLSDGTILHVSIWVHRYGGQVQPGFIAQPQAAGWTQVLVAPLDPAQPAPLGKTGGTMGP